ncbi:MAG TPA: hypothetical protein GX723_09295 [Thermoanaerobacterales bacterium]|jgi:hypothetical protein|nr:hypothetical protein [Thermoanaerobacterales bacterium]
MFLYGDWDNFCRKLSKRGLINLTASMLLNEKPNGQFVILKHDVETNPKKALYLALIENRYSLVGTYYVQAYLLNNSKNIAVLKRIQELGHEVSYHHDAMDSNKGDIQKAINEFQRNVEIFENNGFSVQTVCQHGNPVVERRGYTSNRDFFRDTNIAAKYKHITEIMVNFKPRLGKEYKYISDAGYGWKIIYDPENNDVVNSDDKNIALDTLDDVLGVMENGSSIILSTHPHRWNSNAIIAKTKKGVFKGIKAMAKMMLQIPFMKKLIERFYYLAKKI